MRTRGGRGRDVRGSRPLHKRWKGGEPEGSPFAPRLLPGPLTTHRMRTRDGTASPPRYGAIERVTRAVSEFAYPYLLAMSRIDAVTGDVIDDDAVKLNVYRPFSRSTTTVTVP